MRPLLGKALLLGFGLLMGLLVLEGGLRLARPQIFRAPQGMYVADDAVGYALTPGFEGVLEGAEFRTPFTTNQDGLRGESLRPRQPNTVRILVLGDSQAWGYGVLDEETLSVQLERQLAEAYPGLDIQVLNAGVPGYGTVDQLAFLRSRGRELDPDLVVVQFLSVNDLKENRTPAASWATVEDGWLVSRQAELVEAQPQERSWFLEIKNLLKRKSHLARFAIDNIGYMATRAGLLGDADVLWGEDFTAEDARLGTELLVQIAEEARALGAETLLLYTTGQASLYQDAYVPLRSAAIVEDAAREAGVPWIDGAQRLQAWDDRDGLYFRLNGHWTAAGQRAIAEVLAREMAGLGLIEGVVAVGGEAKGAARLRAAISIPEQSEWQDRGVAIRRGEEGTWDRYLEGGFANNLIKLGDTYFHYYQGSEAYDDTCDSVARRAIGVATSKDGIHWEKYAGNPVISWSSQGSVEEGAASAGVWPGEDGKVYAYYGANTGTGCTVNADIRLAVSADGYTFEDAGVVAAHTDREVWSSGDELFPVGAYAHEGAWHVFYVPNGGLAQRRLGVLSGSAPSTLETSAGVNGGRLPVWGTASVVLDGSSSYLFANDPAADAPLAIYRFAAGEPQAATYVGSYAFAGCVRDSSVFYDRAVGRWLLLCRDSSDRQSYRIKTAEDPAAPAPAPAATGGM